MSLSIKNLIICDIDGTLADPKFRIHHIKKEPKDWDAFYEDCLTDGFHWDIIDLVNRLKPVYEIIFLTGRSEKWRKHTFIWLSQIGLHEHKLLMRTEGDRRHDYEVKLEILNKYDIKPENVLFVLEDRNQVVKALRYAGYRVLQVKEGDY